MNTRRKKKAIVLSLVLAALALTANNLNAQNGGGLFERGFAPDNAEYQSRGLINIEPNSESGISNYGIGEPVPLGSGLLILTVAGAGYAAMRRKRSRKGTALLLACVLLIGFTQCKKEQSVEPTQNQGVHITLSVDNGASTPSTGSATDSATDGSRVIVNPYAGYPDYATVTFEDGDEIWVGNNGVCCGGLEYEDGLFKGFIDPASEDDYLHFYFLGNKGIYQSESGQVIADITDQRSEFPVISYAHSTVKYNPSLTSYTAKLQNYCALAVFQTKVEEEPLWLGIDAPVTINGMNNTVSVNFGANNAAAGAAGEPFTFSKSGDGNIILHPEIENYYNTIRWAILLPQEAVTGVTATAPGYGTSAPFDMPKIVANSYPDRVLFVNFESSLPIGALNGLFIVDESGKQVFFSQGNMQYQASSATWRFAENQWDYVGNGNANISPTYDGWIDLFGWGTKDDPTQTSTNNPSYGWADWGGNAISNGSNTLNCGWRTLSKDEWDYLLFTRSNGYAVNGTANARYTLATINTDGTSVHGMILFPDSYSDGRTNHYPNYGDVDGVTWGTINFTGGAYDEWTTRCTTAGWAGLESKGCVFLPAAGIRNGTTVYSPNEIVYCWTSSPNDNNTAYGVHAQHTVVEVNDNLVRHGGMSVRLVRNSAVQFYSK